MACSPTKQQSAAVPGVGVGMGEGTACSQTKQQSAAGLREGKRPATCYQTKFSHGALAEGMG